MKPAGSRTCGSIRVGLGLAVMLTLAITAWPSAALGASPAAVPQNVWGGNQHVPGFRLTPRQAIVAAAADPRVQRAVRGQPNVRAGAFWLRGHQWDVIWIRNCTARCLATAKITNMTDQLTDVTVSDITGRVTQVWTGVQAETNMARGEAAYVGRLLWAPYIWIPLCLLFVAPFFDWRRPFRLLHLDLLALLGFSVSEVFFARADIYASIKLIYPVLAYLLVRMLIVGLRPGRRHEPLLPHVSPRWLIFGIVALAAFRIVLNLANSPVLDVGVSGVVGADLITHGHQIYGGQLGALVQGGDTYGPVSYLAYVPFWLAIHGSLFSNPPAAHAAAIFFDLVTLGGLFVLGRRLRPGSSGTTLGLALAYGWASYPYSAFTLAENTNDALLAALLVLTLVVMLSPVRRGILLALASLVKFVPIALVPLVATGRGPWRERTWLKFAIGFVVTSIVALVPFVHPSTLHAFYNLTLGAQLKRQSPLSLWGQVPALKLVKDALELATVAFAVALAWRPRTRSRGQIAALSAAIVIAIECCVSYWYYTYIVWFAPLVLVALFTQYRVARVSDGAPEHQMALAGDELAAAELVS